MKTLVKRAIRKIPLIAGLSDCTIKDHFEAFQELLITLVGALLPIYLGAWVIIITCETNYYDAIIKNISDGELMLYSTSLISPILYIATTNKQGDIEFPTKRSHIVIVSLLMVFSSVTFGLQRSGMNVDPKILFNTSILFFIISVFLLYLAVTYKNRMLPKGPEDMKSQEKSFSIQYGKHR